MSDRAKGTCRCCAPYPCHPRVPRRPVFIPFELTLADREMARIYNALAREMDQTILGAFRLPPDMVQPAGAVESPLAQFARRYRGL